MDTVSADTSADAALDFHIYQHACKMLDQQPSREAFEQGYAQGQFHFSSQDALLAELMQLYQINLQQLAGEWLASTANASAYGEQPLKAALKLITKLHPIDK